MPLTSIIIATHDRPHLLPRAVESARGAGKNVEIVVVDDASTDETAAVCGTLAGVKYVRVEQNLRVAGARNIGLLASSGQYVSFLDDDDLRLPGSLDTQAEVLRANPEVGFVYGQAWLADQNGEQTGEFYPNPCPRGDIFWDLLERNFIGCPSAVFRRSCLYRVGLPAADLPGIEDWDLWLRIAELYPVAAVERPVAIYRKGAPGSGQFTSDAAAMVRRITRAHRERWMTLPRAAAATAAERRDARRRFSRNMATHLIWETGRAVRHAELLSAGRNALAAVRLHPAGVLHRATRPSNFRFLLARAARLRHSQ